MQALFNRMLLYPPVQMRAPALRAIRPLLQSPAGLLRLAGPKLDPDTGRPLDARSNLGLLRIVVDCIVEVSRSSDSGLRYLSVDLMHTLLTTIEQLAGCAKTDLAELADPAVIAEAFFDASAAAAAASSAAVCQDGDSSTGDASSEFAATSSACSDSGQQPQDDQAQCANDYVLLMVQLLPQLCEAASDADLDEQLQAFSSDFCTARQLRRRRVSKRGRGVLCISVDPPPGCGGAGPGSSPRITEAAFLSSVLDSGLLLCTSRAWLREIYRLVADQRILTFPAAVAKDSILLSNLAQLGAETPSSASGEWRRTREPQELWAHWLLLASWDAVVVVLGGTVERGERGAPLAVLFGTDAVLEDARQA
uniref:Mon2_C domain-containing protein n=1 Tax=Macrostomum lignano TaxID=282301 RepID=A0A1I8HF12_9PLAT